MEFAEAGIDVIGLDVDAQKVARLREGRSHIEDVADERLGGALERCTFTTRFAGPARRPRRPDLRPHAADRQPRARARAAAQRRARARRRDAGRPDDRARVDDVPRAPRASTSCRCWRSPACAPAHDFALAFSPERVDPGRTDYTIRTTPKIVGGLTPALHRARRRDLRPRSASRSCPVGSPEVAEMAKLLENIFRSVNIALVNEMAMLADRMEIDIWEVVDAASTKPFGFMRFEPGPGMGGHCLPVDPFYLTWRAREYDLATEFIELAGKVNTQMPYFCVEKIEQALNDTAQVGARLAHPRARRLLQAGRRRHPRVAGAEDHRAAPGARRRRRLPRSARPRAARRSASRTRDLDDGARGRRPGRDRDRPPGRRPRRDRHAPRRRRSTSAASRGTCATRTSCSSRPRPASGGAGGSSVAGALVRVASLRRDSASRWSWRDALVVARSWRGVGVGGAQFASLACSLAA